MRLQEKSISKLTLLDLLRRKRKDLKMYLTEAGIVTYERLVRSCTSIGVSPPSEQEFMNALGNPSTPMVSSPTDGILVLEPPPAEVAHQEEVTNEQDEEQQEEIQQDNAEQQKSTRQPKKRKKPSDEVPVD